MIHALTAPPAETMLADIATALVKDPKAIANVLEDIQKHRDKANEIVAEANARIAKAEQIEASLGEREATLIKDEAQLVIDSSKLQTERNMFDSAKEREEGTLGTDKIIFAAEKKASEDELAEREAAVAERESINSEWHLELEQHRLTSNELAAQAKEDKEAAKIAQAEADATVERMQAALQPA